MNMKVRLSVVGVLAAWLVLASDTALAAAPVELTVDQQIEMARSLNEASRQATVAANVQMSQQVSDAFWPVYRSYRGEVGRINDGLKSVILRYASDYSDLAGNEAYDLSEEVLELQVQRDRLKQKYLKQFAKVMPELDAARVMQIENKLDALALVDLAASVPMIRPRGN